MSTKRLVAILHLKLPGSSILAAVVLALALPGCMVRDAYRQIAEMDTICSISGTVAGDQGQPGPYIVALIESDAELTVGRVEPADFFVMERGGQWVFAVAPGRYRVIAFRDLDGDLSYSANEPLAKFQDGEVLSCGSGQTLAGIDLIIADDARPSAPIDLTLSRQRGGFLGASARSMMGLGQATAFGEVTTLDHARFAMENATDSLWRPVDFMSNGHAGVYFLQPYDPELIPVLFVHGINGSPRVFTKLIGSLDRSRFQPWVYYYPSGIGLKENSNYLTNIMLDLEVRHDVEVLHVIAHSMGGLVARDFLLRRDQRGSPARVPIFIPLSAPWSGHGAAGRAVDTSPLVLPVWKDLAPGSEYLEDLFSDAHADQLADTSKHLLFSYRGGDQLTWGTSDGVISLASLLRPRAQDEATSIYGYDTTHIGILEAPEAIARVNRILANE